MSSEPASNLEWRAWGALDPLFGVSAQRGRERNGPNPWTEDEFYSRGETDWTTFLTRWHAYGLDRNRVVEIGCGAGRITRLLARDFSHVHGIDVSADMIRFASSRISNPNLTFHLTDGVTIPLPDAQASAVFSTHVFQHFDTLADAARTFREVARVLAPQGSMMIHVPIYHWPLGDRMFEVTYRMWKKVGDGRARIRRFLLRKGLGRPIMRKLAYPIPWLYRNLPEWGLGDVEVQIISPSKSNDPHPFVFARRVS